MNKLNKLVVVFCSILLFAGSSIAAASCKQADAKGTWRVHGVVWDVFGVDETESFKCKIKIGSSGGVSASKSTCKVFTAGSVDVTGGNVVMASNCAMTGKMITVAGTIKFRSGQMDRSKNSFTAVGVDSLEDDLEYFISGIRQ